MKKNKLDQNTQQNHNEIAGEMICASNVDYLSQMVSNNKIRDSLILEKITTQKENESKQLGEEIRLNLGVYLRDKNKTEVENRSFKRRSKCIAKLKKIKRSLIDIR